MKKTPLKRKTPLKAKSKKAKRKKKPSTTALRKKCDKVWSKIIRSVGRCDMCYPNQPTPEVPEVVKLDAHHLIRRETLHYRHNLKNGICLCFKHHQGNKHRDKCSAHGASRQFSEQLNAAHPQQSEWWDANRHQLHYNEKADYAARLVGLEAIWHSIESGKTTREDHRDWSD